ncbi:hypothetical protein UP21_01590 [Limosilactobacillus fermentum]|nr:hypothetical protein UP21_01590 [Limosilactobacillus fermentum]MCT3443921.1 hypothetical protein [Limosilactobacillus fermentum]PJF07685.1 hypothetical protein CUJ85_00325 [Limosilactobacillus fermentum]
MPVEATVIWVVGEAELDEEAEALEKVADDDSVLRCLVLELVPLDSEMVVWLVVVRLVAVVKPCHPIPLISPMIKRVISE